MLKEKMIRNYIDSGEHVFVSLKPFDPIDESLSAEGVIKRLDANGWFQLEFMGSINGYHISQVQSIITD